MLHVPNLNIGIRLNSIEAISDKIVILFLLNRNIK